MPSPIVYFERNNIVSYSSNDEQATRIRWVSEATHCGHNLIG